MKRTAQIVTALASLLCVSGSALAQDDAITRRRRRQSARSRRRWCRRSPSSIPDGANFPGGKLTMSGIAAELHRVRRSSGESGRACAYGRFHQAMGRGQRQLRQGPAQCDDIGAEQRRIGDRGRRRRPEDPQARWRHADVRGRGAGRRASAAPMGPPRCSSTGSPPAAVLAASAWSAALGWHAPVWHGGWYAHPARTYGAGLATGALVGAAAASAYRPVLSASSLRLLPLSALLLRARHRDGQG